MRDPLAALRAEGQSIWIDHFGRRFVAEELPRRIARDGASGVTSNPTLFAAALERGEYDDAIRRHAPRSASAAALFERLALEDIRAAADTLRPVWEQAGGADGYVSLELPPTLAFDTARSIAEGRRLFRAIGRPNALVKVPATAQGIEAIRALIAAGVNVNVTLLFSQARYRQVLDAYLLGLEERLTHGLPIDGLFSVASFFVSRIDTLVDKLIDASGDRALGALRGQAAVANARLAYATLARALESERTARLRRRGARRQRLLWASTSTKDPRYRDVLYVEELVGRDTISTMPLATLDAFRDHGRVEGQTIEREVEQARALFSRLEVAGIDMESVGRRLEDEGVQKFTVSWNEVGESVDRQRAATLHEAPAHAPP